MFGLALVPAVSAKQWKRLCVEQACSQQLLYVAVGASPGGLLMLLGIHDFPCLLLRLQLAQVSLLWFCVCDQEGRKSCPMCCSLFWHAKNLLLYERAHNELCQETHGLLET